MKKYIVYFALTILFFTGSTKCYSQKKSKTFPNNILNFKGHSFESNSYISVNLTEPDSIWYTILVTDKECDNLSLSIDTIKMQSFANGSKFGRMPIRKDGQIFFRIDFRINCLPPIANDGKELYVEANIKGNVNNLDACKMKMRLVQRKDTCGLTSYYKSVFVPMMKEGKHLSIKPLQKSKSQQLEQ